MEGGCQNVEMEVLIICGMNILGLEPTLDN